MSQKGYSLKGKHAHCVVTVGVSPNELIEIENELHTNNCGVGPFMIDHENAAASFEVVGESLEKTREIFEKHSVEELM